MVISTSGKCPITDEKFRLYRDITHDFRQWFDCLVILILLALLPVPLIPATILNVLRIIELSTFNQTYSEMDLQE